MIITNMTDSLREAMKIAAAVIYWIFALFQENWLYYFI